MLIPREKFAEMYESIKNIAEESNRRSCALAAAAAGAGGGGGGGLDDDACAGAGAGAGSGGCFVLLLAAMSCDAVCAARMFTTLLQQDAISFRLAAVADLSDIARAVRRAREPVIVMLDCGVSCCAARRRVARRRGVSAAARAGAGAAAGRALTLTANPPSLARALATDAPSRCLCPPRRVPPRAPRSPPRHPPPAGQDGPDGPGRAAVQLHLHR